MTNLVNDFLEAAKQELLSRNFSPLRLLQREVLEKLAAGSHVFANLPTGYGKSLCYWLPGAAWGWRVWVVCPLLSLIEDQALSLEALGIEAASWGADPARFPKMHAKLEEGRAQILLLSPERLLHWESTGYFETINQLGFGPDLLALDEMHCMEDWRSFRSSYSHLFALLRKQEHRGVKILGLSASMSRIESDAWMREFCDSHEHVGSSLGRENLELFVLPIEKEEERWWHLLSYLQDLNAPEAAIVYCSTKTECDEVALWLRSAGVPAVAYHAGLPREERVARSKGFRSGLLRVVCATSAFGMGIDYPFVRRVLHFSMPYDVESYWQEVGRAGRDGAPSTALALWRRSDVLRGRRLNEEQKEKFFRLWKTWVSKECRKQSIARVLGVSASKCGKCDQCWSGEESVHSWMRSWQLQNERTAWWSKNSARLERWAEEKIFPLGKSS